MQGWDEVLRCLTGDPHYTGIKTTFEALRGILAYLGSPEQHLRFVHVAGTNGKGSACRMMQSVLTAAGYRTGLFISPHLQYMNERWTIDGEMISDEELKESSARVRAAVAQYNADRMEAAAMASAAAPREQAGQAAQEALSRQASALAAHLPAEERPVAFALLTLLALDYFAREHCDIVVLEVGIGGRLDSTNVIPVPELALIMNLGLEHTELLGNTIEEIAFEKGGIIKPGGRVVLYHQSEEAERVIRGLCRDHGAQLVITAPQDLVVSGKAPTPGACAFAQKEPDAPPPQKRKSSFAVPTYSYHEHTKIRLSLTGQYQRRNLLAVLEGIDVLRGRGWSIPEEAICRGLETVTWPGRFEILSRDPLVIVDGAHNPNGVEALVQNVEDPEGPLAPFESRQVLRASSEPTSAPSTTATESRSVQPGDGRYRILFVFGAMADKDIPEMLRLLAPYAAGFIMETVPDGEGRAESAEVLGAAAGRYFHGSVRTASSIEEALTLALQAASEAKEETAILCCGSLYQVAQIREFFSC